MVWAKRQFGQYQAYFAQLRILNKVERNLGKARLSLIELFLAFA